VDISQVPELVDKSGYPLLIDSYEGVQMMHPLFADVRPVTDDVLYGDKGSVITGMGEPVERDDNQPFAIDEFQSAYTWQSKTHQWGIAFKIPERMVRASNAVGRITRIIEQQAMSFGQKAALKKDQWVADVLQKGTLTAGSAQFFDGSFPGNVDANPKFIFTGLPFFDAAHTITIGSSTYSNHDAVAALSSATLTTAKTRIRYTNNVDERGGKMQQRANLLIVPPGLESQARVILDSEKLPGSTNNDTNVHRSSMDLLVWDFLDDSASASAWWLTQARSGSLRVYDSGTPQIEVSWDPNTKCWLVTMQTYFGVTVRSWKDWYCGNKAAA